MPSGMSPRLTELRLSSRKLWAYQVPAKAHQVPFKRLVGLSSTDYEPIKYRTSEIVSVFTEVFGWSGSLTLINLRPLTPRNAALMVLRWPTLIVLRAIALRAERSGPHRADSDGKLSQRIQKGRKNAAARPLNRERAARAAEGRIMRVKLRPRESAAAFALIPPRGNPEQN
jgi:hypothetical protein